MQLIILEIVCFAIISISIMQQVHARTAQWLLLILIAYVVIITTLEDSVSLVQMPNLFKIVAYVRSIPFIIINIAVYARILIIKPSACNAQAHFSMGLFVNDVLTLRARLNA